MHDSKPIRLGTRGSALALAQAEQVARLLATWTPARVEIIVIKTRGDKITDVPLTQVEGKGFFTKEIEEALLSGVIDLAVHSLKDLPVESPPGLTIGAIPEREDPSEVLLIREGRLDRSRPLALPPGAVVGTTSRRRVAQLRAIHPDIRVADLRGNITTRVRKLQRGQYDAILIARAGLLRLKLQPEGCHLLPVPLSLILPAPGQGALAMQVREDDRRMLDLVSKLHHAPTAEAVTAERRLLAMIGGGCSLPLGAFATRVNGQLRLEAVLGPAELPTEGAVHLLRCQAAADSGEEVAREVCEQLRRTASTINSARLRVLMPVISNSARPDDVMFPELPIELHALPLLEIRPLSVGTDIKRIREQLADFDWIVFSSANGVREFCRHINPSKENQLPQVACVGPGTAAFARQCGLEVAFVPSLHTGEALAQEFNDKFRGRRYRILLARPKKVAGGLQAGLESAGHEVTPCILYETRVVAEPPLLPFRPGPEDLIIFRSPSASKAFLEIYGLASDTVAMAIGPTTAAALSKMWPGRIITAPEADRQGLRQALQNFLAERGFP